MANGIIAQAHPAVSFLDESGRYRGILSWILSTDHKRIGMLYLTVMFTMFTVAVFLGIILRIELLLPGKTIIEPTTYNAVFTLHGVIMIFMFVIPGLSASLGNIFLPIHIGAKDVAFPRLNLLSWYLFLTGALLAVTCLFTGQGPPDTGWTFYAPYSTNFTRTNVALAVFAAFLLGFSSILTGLNFVTTVHRMRAPGMGFFRMPLFTWSLYATAWVQVLATPVVGITLLMVCLERFLGMGFFDPTKGGDPILFQHLFWIYSHPAVYVMILPAMGVVSEIIAVHSRRTIFGYKAIALSSMAIALVGYLVWGHHMFTSGMSDTGRIIFSFLTFFVAVPTAIKIFNWTATMYKGSISLTSPMLYAVSFIFLFSIGGLTGLMQAAIAVDIHLHDTAFIVAHFHYTIFGGTAFALFGALHHWFHKMFGKMYHEGFAKLSWAILFIGFNLHYFTMFIIGYQGMPRRYYDYVDRFTTGNFISGIGAFIMVTGLFMMIDNLLYALIKNPRTSEEPWRGTTLEWTTSSPPPLENFETIPHIEHGPYEFKGETA